MLEEYRNISGEQRIAKQQPTWRKDRDKRCMDTAHAFITKTCLDAGKILHEDAIFELYMATKLERVLLPSIFSKLYHSMIPNLIKAVHTHRAKPKESTNVPNV